MVAWCNSVNTRPVPIWSYQPEPASPRQLIKAGRVRFTEVPGMGCSGAMEDLGFFGS